MTPMSTNHTPGKWTVVDRFYCGIAEPVCLVGKFAVVTDGRLTGDDGKTDAKLIAKLPEMLEALRLAYAELNAIHARCGVPWWPSGKSDVTQEHFTSVVEKVRAALAL